MINFESILTNILSEAPSRGTQKTLEYAIKNRMPVSFDYRGPRGEVLPGRRIKTELVASGLTKKGNLAFRGWVQPPSVSKKGFKEHGWRTFILDRISAGSIQVYEDEQFDNKRPGYKEGDDSSFSTTYVTSDWSEVTIEQYSNIYSIDTNIHQGPFYSFELIHQLSGIDREIIEQIDFDDFKQLIKALEFFYKPVEDLKKESIIVDGEEYFLYSEFNKYTAGEIISIETILQSVNGDVKKVMPKLLCIFLRKKKENGNLEKYNTKFMSREEKFKKIKISEINHIFNFFLTGRDSLLNNMTDSSKNNEK